MAIFSGVEKYPEQLFDERLSLSLRLPILLHLVLGRAPVRRLAQSLITILLLISPLSFSTDKITNFVYECPVATGSVVKTERTVVVQRAFAVLLLPVPKEPAVRTAVPLSLTPRVELLSVPFPSRAPPV